MTQKWLGQTDPKGLTKPKIARKGQDHFLNKSRTLPNKTRVLEGDRTWNFTPKSSKIFGTQVLVCGTCSVPELWLLPSSFSIRHYLHEIDRERLHITDATQPQDLKVENEHTQYVHESLQRIPPLKVQHANHSWHGDGRGPDNQESPRQTKPKKGPKRKVHEFRTHFCVNSGVFP